MTVTSRAVSTDDVTLKTWKYSSHQERTSSFPKRVVSFGGMTTASSANKDTIRSMLPDCEASRTRSVGAADGALLIVRSLLQPRFLLHEPRHVPIRSDADGLRTVPNGLPHPPRIVRLMFPNCQHAAIIAYAVSTVGGNDREYVC